METRNPPNGSKLNGKTAAIQSKNATTATLSFARSSSVSSEAGRSIDFDLSISSFTMPRSANSKPSQLHPSHSSDNFQYPQIKKIPSMNLSDTSSLSELDSYYSAGSGNILSPSTSGNFNQSGQDPSPATNTSTHQAMVSPSGNHGSHALSPKKLWGSIDLINRRKFSAQTMNKLHGSGISIATAAGSDGSTTPVRGIFERRESSATDEAVSPPKNKLLNGIKNAIIKARQSLPNISAGSIDKLALTADPMEEENQKSAQVEQYLKKEKQKFLASQREPRILLLGTSDSGKSTLIKIMKILHGSGFTDMEKEKAKNKIMAWLIYSLDKIISIIEDHDFTTSIKSPDGSFILDGSNISSGGLSKSNGSISSSSNKPMYKELTLFKEVFFDNFSEMQSDEDDGVVLPERIRELVLEAVKDPEILFVLNQARRIHGLPDTMSYFFDRAATIVATSYSPTNQDILNLRTVTKSISTTTFTINDTPVHFIDVSGLLHNRKTFNINKVPFFDDVNSILYMVSLSSYDQTVPEDGTINRLQDSVVLFDNIVHNQLLQNTHIILLFNKKDLFLEKAKTISLNIFFPEYKGKPHDSKMYFDFIKKLYIRQIRSERRNNSCLSIHITQCNSIDTMKAIMGQVVAKVIERRLDTAVF